MDDILSTVDKTTDAVLACDNEAQKQIWMMKAEKLMEERKNLEIEITQMENERVVSKEQLLDANRCDSDWISSVMGSNN
ncbi:MAG: hypothetical protein HQK52_23110 [Oligoflexia bacterium]|nr:hypothetical protein [Oligoflexia bacterium]